MRSIDSRLDRFCYKHPKLGIPNLMLIIVIGNILVFLLDMFSPAHMSFSSFLTFAPYSILHGQIWRLITFIFVPLGGNVLTVLLSLYFYWWIGSTLEREWGSAKFTVFYAMGMLFTAIVGFVLYFPLASSFSADVSALLSSQPELIPEATASALSAFSTASPTYLNLSLFFAFATLYPDMRVLLFFFIPVKIKWLAWVDAALFAWSIVSSLFSLDWVGAVLPVVALLNYLLFFWSDIRDFSKRMFRRARRQNARQTVNFKAATRHAQQQKGYIHKCAVCGKTDTDYPSEEFRYCSKCNGYYCYCSEHIQNHVHIQ